MVKLIFGMIIGVLFYLGDIAWRVLGLGKKREFEFGIVFGSWLRLLFWIFDKVEQGKRNRTKLQLCIKVGLKKST